MHMVGWSLEFFSLDNTLYFGCMGEIKRFTEYWRILSAQLEYYFINCTQTILLIQYKYSPETTRWQIFFVTVLVLAGQSKCFSL
jgi:hypothetical protein